MLITFVTGCSGNTEIILTTGFGDNEVFRMGDISCSSVEVLCYLANIKNQYSSVFGQEIWSTSQNGVYLCDGVKDMVMSRLMKVKTMQLMATDYGLELSENEKKAASDAGKEYYDSLTDTERAAMNNITQAALVSMYEEYALAEKVYSYVIKDVNTEISDDEARTIIIEEMTFSLKEDADEMYAALEEGQEFEALLISNFGEGSEELYYRKGELESQLETAAFNLGAGEYTSVISDGEKYYILYCVNPNDTEKTDITKQEILSERRRSQFEQVYNEFSADKESYLNSELWDSLSYELSAVNGTADFFDIYDKYF